MGTIPGPIIRFVVDQPGLSAAVAPAMQQMRDQAKATSAAIAEQWRQDSAKIRASIATTALGQKEVNAEQQKLSGILEQQISKLRERNDLTNRELANLKAMTLEYERLKSSIAGGSGLTASTQAFLGQVKNIGLQMTSLLGSGLTGIMGGSQMSAVSALLGSGGLAVGGVAALTAAAAGVVKLSVDGGKLAVELTNLSSKTGLTVESLVKLRSASAALDVDFDRVVTGFRKFDQEIVLASSASLPNATKAAKQAGAIFAELGVDVKKAAADPFSAIDQLSKSLGTLPDSATKTALAVQLFGRGGMELLPILNRLPEALAATSSSSLDLARSLGVDAAKSAEEFKSQLVNFDNELDVLEVTLARGVLPELVKFVGLVTDVGSALKTVLTPVDRAENAIAAQLQAQRKQLTGAGQKQLDFFLTTENVNSDISRYVANPQQGIDDFKKYLSGELHEDASKTFEAFQNVGQAAVDTSKKTDAFRRILGTTGDAAEDASKKIKDLYDRIASESQRARPGQTEQQKFDQELYRTIGPALGLSLPNRFPAPVPPSITFPLPPTVDLGLPGLPGAPKGAPQSVRDQLSDLLQSETDKIKAQYDAQIQHWRDIQNEYPDVAKQASDAIVKIKREEADKLKAITDKEFEKYKSDADKLFDDLLSGKTKSFTKALEKDIEDIVTEPARKMFENIMGKMLQGLDQTINGKVGAGSGAGSSSSSGLGGFGGVLARIGLGGTAGTFPGSTGLGANGKGSVAIQSGQTGVMTNTMNVQANVVNIGTGTGSSSGTPSAANFTGGGLLPAFGSFFGNNNPFGGGTSFWGNNNPLGGSTSAGGLLNGQLGPLVGGLLVGGLGVKSGSISSEAAGAAGVATALANVFGASNASPIGYPGPNGPQNLGSQLGSIFGGLGTMVSGIAAGGLGGTLEATAGGASIGTAILPGIGTAIGAGVGLIAGVLSSIIGGESWKEAVKHDMNKQSVYLPPSESFNFAEGSSISQTMSQGFSQSGSTFSTFQLPSNTPFWANPIYGPLSKLQQQKLAAEQGTFIPGQAFGGLPSVNPFTGQGPVTSKKDSTTPNVNVQFNLPGLMDQNAATAVFTQHGSLIAGIVGNTIASTNSGFGRNIRSAVGLP